jgi:hypothetical protein
MLQRVLINFLQVERRLPFRTSYKFVDLHAGMASGHITSLPECTSPVLPVILPDALPTGRLVALPLYYGKALLSPLTGSHESVFIASKTSVREKANEA